MAGIDYSKWDKLDVSSSDSDAASGASSHSPHAGDETGRPYTTKLSYPSRVVIGPNGAVLQDMPPPATTSPFRPAPQVVGDDTRETAEVPESAPTASASTQVSVDSSHPTSSPLADEEEAMDIMYTQLTRNGGCERDSHLWSQSADGAMVSFFVPASVKARHITHFAITADTARESKDQPWLAARVTIDVSPDDSTPLHIDKCFRYPIKLDEALLEGCWQLQSLPDGRRLLVAEVFKASLGIAGMTLWWDRCFVDDTIAIVDTQQIGDRKDGSSATQMQSAFQKTWAEAHEMFRARMKKRREAQQ